MLTPLTLVLVFSSQWYHQENEQNKILILKKDNDVTITPITSIEKKNRTNIFFYWKFLLKCFKQKISRPYREETERRNTEGFRNVII